MLDGEWRIARRVLEDALHDAPNDPLTLTALAFLLTAQGNRDAAASVLDRAVAADPLAALLAADAGLMLLWAGRTEEAVHACAEAVALRPDATWAIGCAFDAEAIAGRFARAAAWGRRLLVAYGVPEVASRAEPQPEYRTRPLSVPERPHARRIRAAGSPRVRADRRVPGHRSTRSE
jgi:tetratricopeptide (TPR) repeat protein